jgi:hypothetical protein
MMQIAKNKRWILDAKMVYLLGMRTIHYGTARGGASSVQSLVG